jgi:hypothetical protein
METKVRSDPRWMSLIEAVRHIEGSLGISLLLAQVLLKKKIGSAEIPVKWADAAGPKDIPNIRELARSQLVLGTPGLAPDDALSLRPLLVLRAAVRAAWSEEANTSLKILEAPPSGSSHTAWMNLVEAVEHIQLMQTCDSVEALRQLKAEIGGGLVQIIWADANSPDDRPDAVRLSTSELILFGTGYAPDEVDGLYRSIDVQRSTVERLWPSKNSRSNAESSVSLQNLSPNHIFQPEKVPAGDVEIREGLREVFREASEGNKKPPNMNEAHKLLLHKVPNARRELVRDILHEPEFAKLRLRAGHRG